jgi:hypothetical protein
VGKPQAAACSHQRRCLCQQRGGFLHSAVNPIAADDRHASGLTIATQFMKEATALKSLSVLYSFIVSTMSLPWLSWRGSIRTTRALAQERWHRMKTSWLVINPSTAELIGPGGRAETLVGADQVVA